MTEWPWFITLPWFNRRAEFGDPKWNENKEIGPVTTAVCLWWQMHTGDGEDGQWLVLTSGLLLSEPGTGQDGISDVHSFPAVPLGVAFPQWEATVSGPLLCHLLYLSISVVGPGCHSVGRDHLCPFDRQNMCHHMSLGGCTA